MFKNKIVFKVRVIKFWFFIVGIIEKRLFYEDINLINVLIY